MTHSFLRSYLVLCCMLGAGAFLVPAPLVPTAVSKPAAGRVRTALQVVRVQEEPELTVFDAGDVGVSWADYKKQRPNEFKVCFAPVRLFEVLKQLLERQVQLRAGEFGPFHMDPA